MAARSSKLKKLVVRHAWAGPVVGFVLGMIFGPGSLWHFWDIRQKGHAITVEDIRLEKEIFERQQFLLQKSAEDIIMYVELRDQYFDSPFYEPDSNSKRYSSKLIMTGGALTNESDRKSVKAYEDLYDGFDKLHIKFSQQRAKLVSLITEYNQLEAKLSVVAQRQPVWFKLSIIPLTRPNRFRQSNPNAGATNTLSWNCNPDPASQDCVANLKKIFASYGQKWSER